jgi:hypothetical protein
VGDCHIHPARVGNVDVWWKLLQASAGGVLWARTSSLHHISLFFILLRFNSQPRKNMLGYPPRLRLHLGWLIIFLQTMKLGYSRCLHCIVIISEIFVI